MPFRLRRYPVQAPAAQDAQKHLERPSAQDIYEQVANNARQELGRSSVSLAISGLSGGIFMGLSVLGNAIAIALLTPAGSAPTNTTLFVAKMFYPLGFIVVILGRSQPFTENTLYPVEYGQVIYGKDAEAEAIAPLPKEESKSEELAKS